MFNLLCELNLHIQRESKNFLDEYRALLDDGLVDREKMALVIFNIKILIGQIDTFMIIFRIHAESASTIKCRVIERMIDDCPESIGRYEDATALKQDLTAIEKTRCRKQVDAVNEVLGEHKVMLNILKEQLQAGIDG